jgi:quinol monooxygenase YgiN
MASTENNAIALEVHIDAVPGREDELAAHLAELLGPTRKEPGCLAYELHRDPEHPTRLLFYEKFKDQAALDAHLATPHFQQFLAYKAQGQDPVAQTIVNRWSPVD